MLICLVGFARPTFAAQACPLTLDWQPSPDSGVAGYVLYYGADDGPITNRVDVGLQTETVVKDLVASVEYTFYVVAYDADHFEGDPSDPLIYTAEVISPLNLVQSPGGVMSLSFHVAPGAGCWVEYTDTLMPPNWNLLTWAVGDSNGLVVIDDWMVEPSRFYRGVVQ
jgi:fibronectin type III domain protein